MANRYTITSNRESGFGRYDVMMEPKDLDSSKGSGPVRDAIIEFKVRDAEEEASLQDTVKAALQQIEEKCYEQVLIDKGIERDHIWKYGFAFEGKKVLIGR